MDKKRRTRIIATVGLVAILCLASWYFLSQEKQENELGTFDKPVVAFRETQKALDLLSTHLNRGMESVQYLETFEDTKDMIFVADEK